MDIKFPGWPHIIKAQQFSREWIEQILFPTAREMAIVVRSRGSQALAGKMMTLLFYQPSTRTRASFQYSMAYLGGQSVFFTENAKEFSSAAKGESLRHTILNHEQYEPDVIVLRHYQEGAAEEAAKISKRTPIINGGDGKGQHPTQALLDLFTIQESLGRLDDITIAIVGDLRRGRVVRSLCYLLAKFNNPKIHLVSSLKSRMKCDIKDHLREKGIWFDETNDIRLVAPMADVVYMTRDQKEYQDSFDEEELELPEQNFSGNEHLIFDQEVLDLTPETSIVMHPQPIDDAVKEIRPEVEDDPRVIFIRKQVKAGLHIRMALLKILLF
ncbi:MAG: aspartate carbamoyltransferase [Candidatus Nealsonbacteria bacterium]|nr:aspartate carbamoyltransferase [Candidatus Nealsonbacteria bacterium]